MKKLFTVLALLFTGYLTFAQDTVIVNSTVGVDVYGSYSNLKQAFDSINTGYHQGSITIEIKYSHSLGTTTAKLDSSGKPNSNGNGIPASSYTSVLIKPALNAGAITISGNAFAGSPMIDLNGADNVTIDGLNNGLDALILSNTRAAQSATTATIRLQNDACNNSITRVKVLTANWSTTVGIRGGAISIDLGIFTGNDDNIISQCMFSNANNDTLAYKLISIIGSTNNNNIQNSGIQIINNYFVNFRACGVFVSGGTRDLRVSNNHFYHNVPMPSSAVIFSPISITNPTASRGENFIIEGNYIGGSDSLCGGAKPTITLTGSSIYIQPIYIQVANTAKSYVLNNTITNFAVTTSATSNNHGIIGVNNGKVDVIGNTIGNQVDTGALVFTYTGGSSNNFTIFPNLGVSTTYAYDTLRYENNMVGSISVRSVGTGSSFRLFDFISAASNTPTFIIRNNKFGAPGVAHSLNSYATSNNFLLIRSAGATFVNTCEFVGNYIGNITHFNTAAGSVIIGPNFQKGVWRVDSNTMENWTSNTASTGAALAITGVAFTTPSVGSTFIGNTMRNFVSANNTAVVSNIVGVLTTPQTVGVLTGGCTISGNKIANLYALSTNFSSSVFGIRLSTNASSNFNINNNQILLGLDTVGNNVANSQMFAGINRTKGNASIFHNSILITGFATNSDTSTFAFMNAADSGTADVRNNVFVNNRGFTTWSNTQANYAASYDGTVSSGSISGLSTNYNLYYANNTGGALILNSGTTHWDFYDFYQSWKANAYMYDVNSVLGDPLFVSNTILGGASGSAIVAGDPATGVTLDITGATRTIYLMGAYDSYNPTPVKLAYFNGKNQNGNVKLIWSTASETNNKGFYIEKSVNGKQFEAIGFVKGNGTTTKAVNYTLVDENAFAKSQHQLYYRLKQVDFDGKYEYSQTVLVSSKQAQETAQVEVFPNPFSDQIVIAIPTGMDGKVAIFDLQGKEVYSNTLKEGISVIENLDVLSKGIYVMHIIMNGETSVQKIVKQ